MNTTKAGRIAGVALIGFIATAFAATKIDLSPAASQLAGFAGAFLGSLVANGRRSKKIKQLDAQPPEEADSDPRS